MVFAVATILLFFAVFNSCATSESKCNSTFTLLFSVLSSLAFTESFTGPFKAFGFSIHSNGQFFQILLTRLKCRRKVLWREKNDSHTLIWYYEHLKSPTEELSNIINASLPTSRQNAASTPLYKSESMDIPVNILSILPRHLQHQLADKLLKKIKTKDNQ